MRTRQSSVLASRASVFHFCYLRCCCCGDGYASPVATPLTCALSVRMRARVCSRGQAAPALASALSVSRAWPCRMQTNRHPWFIDYCECARRIATADESICPPPLRRSNEAYAMHVHGARACRRGSRCRLPLYRASLASPASDRVVGSSTPPAASRCRHICAIDQ